MRTVLLVFAKELILPAVIPRTAPARDAVGAGRRRCRTAASATQSLPQRRHIIRAKQTRVPRRETSDGAGGEGGIRTPDTVARMPHFECGAFNHSATSPSY